MTTELIEGSSGIEKKNKGKFGHKFLQKIINLAVNCECKTKNVFTWELYFVNLWKISSKFVEWFSRYFDNHLWKQELGKNEFEVLDAKPSSLEDTNFRDSTSKSTLMLDRLEILGQHDVEYNHMLTNLLIS